MTLRGFVFLYLLVAPHVLLLFVLIALLRHRLYRQFPIFFVYVAQEILQAVVMIPFLESSSAIGKLSAIPYSVSLAATTALRFGVVHEVFAHVFQNYAALAPFGKPLFRCVTVGLLLIALALAVYTGVNANQLVLVVHTLNRTASILQCGLLIALFAFSSQLGLSWRSHAFGIALGLGIIASVDLASSAIRSQTGYAYSTSLNYLVMTVYHFSVLIWIFYLFSPERSYATSALPQHDLENWNLELERLLKQP